MDRYTYFDGRGWRLHLGKPAVDRLAAYEETGLEPEEIKSLLPLQNDHLTKDELKLMVGAPVWIRQENCKGRWAIIAFMDEMCLHLHECNALSLEEYGNTWNAYRRKPEEV